MKSLKTKKTIIIGTLIIISITSLLTKQFNLENPLEFIVNSIFNSVFHIENQIISEPIYEIKSMISKREISLEKKLQAENEELRQEINELKKQLHLKESLSEYEVLTTTIISRPLDFYSDEIIIGVGKKDGIDGHYAVINDEGMIGRITQIEDTFSKVTLFITEREENQCVVRILIDSENSCDAVLEKYNSNTGFYTVRLLSTSKTIEKGMIVVTSGMGVELYAVPSALVEGLILQLAHICDHSNNILVVIAGHGVADLVNIISNIARIFAAATAGHKREYHRRGQQQGQKLLLHGNQSTFLYIICPLTRMARPTGIWHIIPYLPP